ncbi:MAG: carbon-nitrogen hydrolase family protein [Deltaproteobacteria bacterium HGW-Deltaproteobacteria-24]|nr:MAG: carbon-nitrogen hydrolase family protein [Deltaproteobacteria bacterium HGW-Deltaproteobacteria-24]
MNLVALQTKTSSNYEENLKYLESIIKEVPKNSLILAPELCLSGYSYETLDKAASFSKIAIERLLECSQEQSIALTMITKKENNYYNTFHLFHEGKIIHTQSKVKLFTLNQEDDYFTAGKQEAIKLFELNGLKIGVLICFELRFTELWQPLKGADIILLPSMWGEKRKSHFEILTQALAVANQCFVIASNCANDDCAKSSAVITPFGETLLDDNQEILFQSIDLKEIQKMRRYLPVGIKP